MAPRRVKALTQDIPLKYIIYSFLRQTLMNTHCCREDAYKSFGYTLTFHAYSIPTKKCKHTEIIRCRIYFTSSCFHLYTDTDKYCNILLKMHIFTMSSSLRVRSCQNHGPKLSVRRLSWGRTLLLKQLPCLAGNVFTVFVPLRCTACLIHHNQTKTTAVIQLAYVGIG